MTNFKHFKWSPICINCTDCCYDFEFDNDPWNLGVERNNKNGEKVSGEDFINYLKQLGGEAAKRIDKLKIDKYGCIEVIIPLDKTYSDLTNCIFLDKDSNCVIHPSRTNLDFDIRGKLCSSYLCEIAKFVNVEMSFLKNHLNKIKEAHQLKYGKNKDLNLLQYLRGFPKSSLKKVIYNILNIEFIKE